MRASTRGAREDARMHDGQNGPLTRDAEIVLHEALIHATGTDPETPADCRRMKGKALVDEEPTRTPEVVQQRQATRYTWVRLPHCEIHGLDASWRANATSSNNIPSNDEWSRPE